MFYLDANFFIFALFDTTTKGRNARKIQKKIIEGEIRAVTSALTLDEIMWVLVKNRKEHLMEEVIKDIYAMPNLEIKEVSPLIPIEALSFIKKYSLTPRDAFHIAIMKELRVKRIISDDKDFDRVREIKRIKL